MSEPHAVNPYASPQAEDQLPRLHLPARNRAKWIVRCTLMILAVPVAVNVCAICFGDTGHRGLAMDLRWLLAIWNAIWLTLLFAALWMIGLWLIESLARAIHFFAGGKTTRAQWLTSLHESLWPMVPVAAMGSMLWVAWLGVFFLASHAGGYMTDVVFQCGAHLLGACVYGNVFWNWYLLRRQ